MSALVMQVNVQCSISNVQFRKQRQPEFLSTFGVGHWTLEIQTRNEARNPEGVEHNGTEILAGKLGHVHLTDRAGLGCGSAPEKIRCACCAARNYFGTKMMSFAAMLPIEMH
jgi:hypothetical protein